MVIAVLVIGLVGIVLVVVVILSLVGRDRLEAGALLEPVAGRVAQVTNVPGRRRDGLETGQALLLITSGLWVHLVLEL